MTAEQILSSGILNCRIFRLWLLFYVLLCDSSIVQDVTRCWTLFLLTVIHERASAHQAAALRVISSYIITHSVIHTNFVCSLCSAVTENTRASYPIDYIDNARIPCVGPHPKNLILLCCDAFGVLPPISRLTKEQAMYHFISGYTAKARLLLLSNFKQFLLSLYFSLKSSNSYSYFGTKIQASLTDLYQHPCIGRFFRFKTVFVQNL